MRGENRNTVWARAFMDELARAGVREICIAPGSRSTPLILAAAADDRLRLYSVVDERSAGFFALGLGKGSGRPAAVITTSTMRRRYSSPARPRIPSNSSSRSSDSGPTSQTSPTTSPPPGSTINPGYQSIR